MMSVVFLFYFIQTIVVSNIFWLRSNGMCFFSFFFSFFFFTLKYTRVSPVLGYIRIVLSYSAPSNQDYIFFFFTSCAWKELTLCLENAHKCVKYSCVTQRLFYNHTAAFAVHIFSLYSVLCLTFCFTEASESCVVIE